MKNILLPLLVLAGTTAFAQVDISKPISLTGTGSDAKVTGIKDVTNPEDALSVAAFQKGSFIYAGTSGGTGSAYTAALTPAITGYTPGMTLYFKAHTASAAGPVTINVNGQGNRTILKNGSNLAANDILSNQLICIVYDGTNFNITGMVTGGSTHYIQNNTPDNALATGQSAGFDITGSGEINGTLKVNGNIGIGTTTTTDRMNILTDANSGLGVRLYGDQNKERYVIESSTSPVFQAGHYRGTFSAKTATQSGDALGYFQAGGYDGSTQRFNQARMVAVATENHSNTNQGTRLEFQTTPNGSTFSSIATRMAIDHSGNVGIGVASINPAIRLEVITATPGHAAYIRNNATTGTNYGIDGEAMGNGATTNIGGYFAAAGATNNYAIIVPPGFGNVGIGYTAPGSKLTVGGVIESNTGGFKFPDATTQTTAVAVANFMGYLANASTIVSANTGYAQFALTMVTPSVTTGQNDDANIFEIINTGTFGVRIKKAGTITWRYNQDIISSGTSGYSDLYAAINGTVVARSLVAATNSQWDGLYNSGSYTVPANAVLTFQFTSSPDITAMDNGLWGAMSITWIGAK